ncbi:hypothetical protein, partial [Klebsiella pneumoniae]|uniref:hypothetical protein n=1 Tax=Klebsiella pneumoniae TaxID=573 RepID=UPI003EE3F6A5
MKKALFALAGLAICLAYGEIRFNQGYNVGADSALCMVALFKRAPGDIATPRQCEGIWINPASMVIRGAYIDAIGQTIP